MELLLELLPEPELGYEGTGTGGAAGGRAGQSGHSPWHGGHLTLREEPRDSGTEPAATPQTCCTHQLNPR